MTSQSLNKQLFSVYNGLLLGGLHGSFPTSHDGLLLGGLHRTLLLGAPLVTPLQLIPSDAFDETIGFDWPAGAELVVGGLDLGVPDLVEHRREDLPCRHQFIIAHKCGLRMWMRKVLLL
jgi:hypothetical protein